MAAIARLKERAADKVRERRYKAQQAAVAGAQVVVDDADAVMRIVLRLVSAGYALRFGGSRDGGVLGVGVYGDGPAPYTVWLDRGANLREWLVELESALLDE